MTDIAEVTKADHPAARLLRIAAWASLIGIAIATLCPIGMRPHSGLSPQMERFAAFAAIGVLFAVAYPRYVVLTAAVVIGAAVLLEVLQLLSHSRHARMLDAAVKIAGGLLGIASGSLLLRLLPRSRV